MEENSTMTAEIKRPFSAQETESCRSLQGKDEHNRACSAHLQAPAQDAIMTQGHTDVPDFGLIWRATLRLFYSYIWNSKTS